MLDHFGPVAREHGMTLAQLVIAWTIHQDGVTHALCGARNRRQALENAAAANVGFSDDELRVINDAIDEYLAVGV